MFPRLSFRQQLLLPTVAGIVAITGALTLLQVNTLEHILLKQIHVRASEVRLVFRSTFINLLAQADFAAIEDIVRQAVGAEGLVYLVVTDSAGRVISNAGWNASKDGVPIPEIAKDRDSLRRSFLPFAMTVRFAGQDLGALFFAFSTDSIVQAQRELWLRSVGLGALAFLVVTVLIELYQRWLTRPIAALKTASEQILAGNYDVRLPATAQHDDFGLLTDSFRRMAGEVRSRIDALSESEKRLHQALQDSIEREQRLGVAQQQLRLAKDEAIALSAAKAKYVSTVSHEIRTPLNAVIGMTSVIKSLPMDRTLRDGILTIEQAAEQLLAIVNNVLDIERIGADAMPLDSVHFDVHKLVAHVMRVVSALPAAGSLDIDSSVDAEVPRFLLGDQGRINQILTNLMSNAVKFTERGSVRLRVSAQAEGPDRVRVRFAVQDTGKGIPRSMHEKVFEAFEQVSAASAGTGLGLTICREFARRMGGEVTLESGEGAGSTFTFSLPLQRGLPQPANEAQRVSALHALGILDSAPEAAFDELVAEAARACEAPIALVSLVDEHRQWFKARVGLEASQTSREQAFCAHAILTPERLMMVPDAQGDPRFSDNPLVTADPRIRFYAAAPLVDATGHALGTLCVLDRVPRELSAAQLAELQRLAGKVTALLTARTVRPLRVLVAEDTPASQLVLRRMLEQLGHSVRVVGDGEQAIRAFAEEPFDLVLLDIQMPVMDGLQAARALRRHERGARGLPIVGLSAYATQKDRENAIESGMTSYLAKPIRASDIATLIAQLGGRPNASMAPAARQGAAGGDAVDEAALRQLSEDLGPEAMAAVLAQFELDARAGLERLRSSAAADDGEQVRRTAHRLKGLFSQFGASAAARHAAELEQAPGGLQAQAARRLIELGPDAIAAVRAAAREMLAAAARSILHS